MAACLPRGAAKAKRGYAVMAGLVPAIHVFACRYSQDVDARDERGHDM
jgi:hypothetical protein